MSNECSRVELAHDSLFRFVQVLLQISHERRAAGADRCRIAGTGLMLAVDVAVCVADMDFPELCQQANANTVG